MMSPRRVLYSPQFVAGYADALRTARADLHDMSFRHACELADLRAEVAELRAVFRDVVTSLRERADEEVTALRRQLMIALARLERDPARPLH
jgi:hypothetical protein